MTGTTGELEVSGVSGAMVIADTVDVRKSWEMWKRIGICRVQAENFEHRYAIVAAAHLVGQK